MLRIFRVVVHLRALPGGDIRKKRLFPAGPGDKFQASRVYRRCGTLQELPYSRKVNVQFRAEAFNVANDPNFSSVSTAAGSGNFGVVTSALGSRILEFLLRATF
jgi:hypothetical protein